MALEQQPSSLLTKPAPFLLHSVTLSVVRPHLGDRTFPISTAVTRTLKDGGGPNMLRERKFVLELVQSFPILQTW